MGRKREPLSDDPVKRKAQLKRWEVIDAKKIQGAVRGKIALLRNAVEKQKKAKAGATIASAVRGKIARTAFVESKAQTTIASAVRSKIARTEVKNRKASIMTTAQFSIPRTPKKTKVVNTKTKTVVEAGISPPKKSSPEKPTKMYEFDSECGVYYQELTLSKEDFININFIPVGSERYGNMKIGKERKEALVRIYNQAVGYGKGKVRYYWTDEIHTNLKCGYWDAIQEGIKLSGGLDVSGKMGGYLIIINYGKKDKEILLYAEQKQKVSMKVKRGSSPDPKDAIFYATEYHRDRYAFSGDNYEVF